MPIQLTKFSAVWRCSVDGHSFPSFSILYFFLSIFPDYSFLTCISKNYHIHLIASSFLYSVLFAWTWNFACGNCCMRISVETADSSDSFPIRWWSMDDFRDGRILQCSRQKMNVRPCSVSRVYPRSCIVPFDHDLVWGHLRKKNSTQNFSFFSATSWKKLNKSSGNRFGLTKMPFSAFLFLNYGDQLGS